MEPSTRILPPLHAGKLTPSDAAFVGKALAVVEHHLGDPSFTTREAASEMGMSRMHLNRRLRKLTGFSTHALFRNVRLKRAQELLISEVISVYQISHLVGFKSHPHFAKTFRKEIGICPSHYRRTFSPVNKVYSDSVFHQYQWNIGAGEGLRKGKPKFQGPSPKFHHGKA